MARDSYIVHIYNRQELPGLKQEIDTMNGIIEDTETGIKYTFHTKEELWDFVAKHQLEMPNQPKSTNLKNASDCLAIEKKEITRD